MNKQAKDAEHFDASGAGEIEREGVSSAASQIADATELPPPGDGVEQTVLDERERDLKNVAVLGYN